MPEISRFYGLVVKMFHNDHPHDWELAQNHESLDPIDPLP